MLTLFPSRFLAAATVFRVFFGNENQNRSFDLVNRNSLSQKKKKKEKRERCFSLRTCIEFLYFTFILSSDSRFIDQRPLYEARFLGADSGDQVRCCGGARTNKKSKHVAEKN